MAISQKQIQDRAYRKAVGEGVDPSQSVVIDNGFVFEDNFPLALRAAVKASAYSDQASGVKRSYTLTFTDGLATLPDTVVEECLNDSTLIDGSDSNGARITSYQSEYTDFLYPANEQLGHYTVQGTSVLYREPSGDAGDFDGSLTLITPGIPDIPTTITDAMTIATDLAEKTIEILANMARGVTQGGAA